MDAELLTWFLGLPINAAVGIAVGYIFVMGIKWALDYLLAKAADNPEEAFRDDLMQAHRELRAEVQELRKELSEAYERLRSMTIELHAIREGVVAMKLELYDLKVEHPHSQEVLHAIIERLESVGNGEPPSSK
jgi:septal ring factor EnvC (AmiA/AmiB activator)